MYTYIYFLAHGRVSKCYLGDPMRYLQGQILFMCFHSSLINKPQDLNDFLMCLSFSKFLPNTEADMEFLHK